MRLTRSLLGDTALAVVLAVLGVLGTAGADLRVDTDVPIDGRGYALVVAAALLLAVRRLWPLLTLGLVAVLASAYLVLGYPYGPILISFAVAVYTAARHRPLSTSLPAAGAALAVLLLHLFTSESAMTGFVGLAPGSAWAVVPYAIGSTVRLVQESAERARAEVIRQSVDDERLRVAQEVHDVVGHGLAAINMQANIALHLLPKDPRQAEAALTAISRSSAEALDELRSTLAVVRRDEAHRVPAASLDGIEELCGRMRVAGMRVDLETSGIRRSVPPPVGLAGYRVVQESLTNALLHGSAQSATVRLRYDDHAVALAISNPASSANDLGEGLGITGMQQRVASVGGDFSAGPTPDGLFEVRALLPTGGDA
jgi:signal transduction histidine kinase